MDQDRQHLRLLSIFHYVVAALTATCGCFPVIHLAVGIGMLVAPETFKDARNPDAPLALMGGMFTGIAAFIIAVFWLTAGLMAAAGYCLGRHQYWTFCLVAAAIACTMMPFGTILGVFTIVVLIRPSVKQLFAGGPPPA